MQRALDKLVKNRTIVIIAHRLSTIEHADIIYVIENGKVAEQGKYSELLQAGGIYADMYLAQFRRQDAAYVS